MVDGLRARLGSWCSALDLADRADIRVEPTAGVPGGVVVCQRVVFFEADCGIAEGQRLVGLGVAAALLAEFFVTFTIADIEPLAAALFAALVPQ